MVSSHERLTIVIKLGTSSIVDEKSHEPLLSILALIVETVTKLRKDGHRVVIVSSGAVGVGLRRMDKDKPTDLPHKQALAAVGQCRLMSLWDNLFSHLQVPVAQILLTRNDIAARTQYVNAENTFKKLFAMDVVPIVNENDTLAVSEIKFGDNDTLSAITAAMVKADYLFLMTDVDCLYTKNPRVHRDALPILEVADISAIKADVSSLGSSVGTGGMKTKITAAKLGTSAGVTTIITNSSKPGNVHEIVKFLQSQPRKFADGDKIENFKGKRRKGQNRKSKNYQAKQPVGSVDEEKTTCPNETAVEAHPKSLLYTCFLPSFTPIQSHTFWLLHGLSTRGTLFIDQGAYDALVNHANLLPVGIVNVKGRFEQQEAVLLVVVDRPSSNALNGDFVHGGNEPKEVGRALVNYGSKEINRIKGRRSTEIAKVLGPDTESECVAIRDNISLHSQDHNPIRTAVPS